MYFMLIFEKQQEELIFLLRSWQTLLELLIKDPTIKTLNQGRNYNEADEAIAGKKK
jgi:hypothetical protein